MFCISSACAIDLGQTVLITGGWYDRPRVSEYTEIGFLRDLPSLQEGRHSHGCTYFVNDQGTKTFLVTGGATAPDSLTSSTELLEENADAWVLLQTGDLPTPRTGLRAANIDNMILVTGGNQQEDYDYYDYDLDDNQDLAEILLFNTSTEEWTLFDTMTERRRGQAVSTISLADHPELCTLA